MIQFKNRDYFVIDNHVNEAGISLQDPLTFLNADLNGSYREVEIGDRLRDLVSRDYGSDLTLIRKEGRKNEKIHQDA